MNRPIQKVILLGIGMMLISCGFLSGVDNPCNSQVSQQFQALQLAEDSKDYLALSIGLAGLPVNVESMKWEIEQRGDHGCVMTLIADVNATDVIGPVYYIDLQTNKVFPDNPDASDVFLYFVENTPSEGVSLTP